REPAPVRPRRAARPLRLPHDAAHRRGRARRGRPRPVPARPCRRRAGAGAPRPRRPVARPDPRRGPARALRPLALVQRLLRGSAAVARLRADRRVPRRAPGPRGERLNVVVHRRWAFALLAVLGALVAVSVPLLGADPWPFRTPPPDTGGVLGPLVRAADGRWDL